MKRSKVWSKPRAASFRIRAPEAEVAQDDVVAQGGAPGSALPVDHLRLWVVPGLIAADACLVAGP